MFKIKQVEFVKSIVHLNDRPMPILDEFAFAGRSNVGKSSLINALTNRKSIAKVSKQPGKTRLLNYFLINDSFYLVDLPGYGYAKVPLAEKDKWAKMIENYLQNNEALQIIFVLIDALVGPQKNDVQLVDWLYHIKAPFKIICTKADRISKNSMAKKTVEFKKILNLNTSEPFIFFSSKTNQGKDELLAYFSKNM